MKKILISSVLVLSLFALGLFATSCSVTSGGGSSVKFPYIYCGNNGDNSVLVINGTTNITVESISLGSLAPYAIAASPDGDKIYVANGSENLLVIDTASNDLEPSIIYIPHSNQSRGMAVSKDGDCLYLTTAVGTTEFIKHTFSPSSNKALVLQGYGERIALNPGSTKAYVCINNSYTIEVVDLSGMTVDSSITLANHPWDIAIKDGYAYVAMSSAFQVIAKVDLSDTSSISYISVGPGSDYRGIVCIPGQDKIYVANSIAAGEIAVISAEAFLNIATTITSTELSLPYFMAATPKYAYVYDGTFNHEKIVVIDVITDNIETYIPGIVSYNDFNNPVVVYK